MSTPSAGGRGGLFRFDPTHFRGRPPEVQRRAETLTRTLMAPIHGFGGAASTRYVPSERPNSFAVEDGPRKVRVTGIDSIAGEAVVFYTDPDGQRHEARVSADVASEIDERTRMLLQLEALFSRYALEGSVGEAVEAELQLLVDRVRQLQEHVMTRIDQELGLSNRLLER